MTKQEFLNELRRELSFLPADEIEEAIEFYDEYFNDAEGSEEQIIAGLGSPKKVAENFYKEYNDKKYTAAQPVPVGDQQPKRQSLPMWLKVILVAAAIVIGVPLVFSAAWTVFGIICGIAALIIGALVLGAALVLGGAAVFIVAFISSSSLAALFLQLGLGLLMLGVGVLLFWLMVIVIVKAVPAVFRFVVDFFGSLVQKRRKKV